MVSELQKLFDIGSWPLWVLIIVLIIAFASNLKIVGGWLWFLVGWAGAFAQKKSTKKRLEAVCSKSLRHITKEVPDMEIPELNIAWVKNDDFKTAFKDNKAIIKLKYSTNQTHNIIQATSVYVKEAFLKHAKPYLGDNLKKAIDFSITKKILLNTTKNTRNIVSQYIEETANEIDDIKVICSQIAEIDDQGLFTRILIREYDLYGQKLVGRLKSDEYYTEAEDFLSFLYDIVTRNPEDDETRLQFNQKTLKAAVLLVAKYETYANYGLAPYLRRIKLGFAQGIETFYMLARDNKVEALENVAKELLKTGNFILINQPKEYRDTENRATICYCIRINKDSSIAHATEEITHKIDTKGVVYGVVTRVKQDALFVNVDGVEGIVKKRDLSIIDIDDVFKCFKENDIVELRPLEVGANGIIEFETKGTKSDPNAMIRANYQIGQSIFCKIEHADDNFIIANVNHESIKGIAFRKDLTYSRFQFLHHLFPVGSQHEFVIHNYDFENNRIRLRLKNLQDPWERTVFYKGQDVKFMVTKEISHSFIGELAEGIEAMLPFTELVWAENEIEQAKSKIKNGHTYDVKIKFYDKKERRIVASIKETLDNPIVEFFNLHKEEVLNFKVQKIITQGIEGVIDNKIKIFIPKSEQSWQRGREVDYIMGQCCQVSLKGINKFGDGLIGTLKPFLKMPLEDFAQNFSVGQVLKLQPPIHKFDKGCTFEISFNGDKHYAHINIGEVSVFGFISSMKSLFNNIGSMPLAIKEIDVENNKISLSLKDLTEINIPRIKALKYDNEYRAIILGAAFDNSNDYSVVLENIWVEGILETSSKYQTGDIITVWPITIGNDKVILTDK